MHPLLEKQQTLHNEATTVLDEYIIPIIRKYGVFEVGGSYVYRLLHFPDIDIDIINPEITKELYSKLCAEFIALDVVSDFETCDRIHYPHGNPGARPTGYWICPKINRGEHVWNIDIWLQTEKDDACNSNSYADRLLNIDDETRVTILSLKEELKKMKLYGVGKEFQSTDVYTGVLDRNVKTVAELRSGD